MHFGLTMTWSGALAMVTDDCIFDATGPAPDGARYVGPEAIGKAWKPIFDDVASSFEAEETFAPVTAWSSAGVTAGTVGTCAASTCSRYAGNRIAEKLSYVKG